MRHELGKIIEFNVMQRLSGEKKQKEHPRPPIKGKLYNISELDYSFGEPCAHPNRTLPDVKQVIMGKAAIHSPDYILNTRREVRDLAKRNVSEQEKGIQKNRRPRDLLLLEYFSNITDPRLVTYKGLSIDKIRKMYPHIERLPYGELYEKVKKQREENESILQLSSDDINRGIPSMEDRIFDNQGGWIDP